MIQLPTHINQPTNRFTDFSILLYGPHKAGKTEFFAYSGYQNSRPFFLSFEPGIEGYPVYFMSINDLPMFYDIQNKLGQAYYQGQPPPYSSIVVDSLDSLYDCIKRYVARLANKATIEEISWGKGWKTADEIFAAVLNRLNTLPVPLYLIGHSRVVERHDPERNYLEYALNLRDDPSNAVLRMVDATLFCYPQEAVGEDSKMTFRPVIKTRQTKHWQAGARLRRLPEELPMNFHLVRQAFEANLKEQNHV